MSNSISPSPHPETKELLRHTLSSLREILGSKMLGLYIFGSAVTEDFIKGVSDVDLLALLIEDLSDQEFSQLDRMHDSLIAKHPAWEGRFEIVYAAEDTLSPHPDESNTLAIVSPGEPFHFKVIGLDWAINWYVLGQQGGTLFGPLACEVFSFISTTDFIEIVRAQVIEWGDWLPHTRDSSNYQAYAVLTLCRSLYVVIHGQQPSKQLAGEWVREHYPDWSNLIDWAFATRLKSPNKEIDPATTYPDVESFADFVARETNLD